MDNFFRHLFGKRESVVEKRESSPTTTASTATTASDYDERVAYVRTPTAALAVSAWHRGVELRMKTMGQLVPQLQRKDRDGGNFVENTYGKAGAMNYRLQVRPNPLMTAATFWQQVEYHRITYGNALVYIERRGYDDTPTFWLCDYGTYDPTSARYNLTFTSEYGLRNVVAEGKDVLHWANTYRYPGTIWGIPTLKFAQQALTLQATEGQQAMENAAKGGRVKLLISEDTQGSYSPISRGMYDKGEMEKYAKEVNDNIYKQDVISLRGLDKVHQISMDAQQMQLLQLLGFGVAEVGRFLGVPLSLLMDYSNSSYKTPEAATQELMMRTIQPQIGEIEDELNSKLLEPGEWGARRYHVCDLPLLRLDLKMQADIDLKRLQSGWSPNEIRAQYDMPAIEGGDDHYVSTNLAVAGSRKLRGEDSPQPAAQAGEHASEEGTTKEDPVGGEEEGL